MSNGLQFAPTLAACSRCGARRGHLPTSRVEDSLHSWRRARGTYLVFPADYDDWTDSLTLDAMAKPVS